MKKFNFKQLMLGNRRKAQLIMWQKAIQLLNLILNEVTQNLQVLYIISLKSKKIKII